MVKKQTHTMCLEFPLEKYNYSIYIFAKKAIL